MKGWTVRLAIAAGLTATLALSACGGSGTSGSGGNNAIPLKIMVGGLSKQIYLPNELTQRLGYFQQEGLNVTLIDEASGQSSEDEVIAGQVDAGSGSYNHTIELQAAGKNMEDVVQLQLAPGEVEMVSAQDANTIHSVADLKGKNLGITELGSGTQTLTEALLAKAGITPDQVHWVPVGAGSTFIAAMQQGKIDAGMTTEPTVSQVQAQHLGSVLVSLTTPSATEQALGGDYPFICVFMATDYVNAHKDVVQKMVNAYVKTLKWMQTHTAEQIADQMPSDYYGGDKASYVQALQNQMPMFSPDGKMTATGPQTVMQIEYLAHPDLKSKNIDLSQTFTNEFTNNAS